MKAAVVLLVFLVSVHASQTTFFDLPDDIRSDIYMKPGVIDSVKGASELESDVIESTRKQSFAAAHMTAKGKALKPASRHDRDLRRLNSEQARQLKSPEESLEWTKHDDKIEASHLKYLQRKALKSDTKEATARLGKKNYKVSIQDGHAKIRMYLPKGNRYLEWKEGTPIEKRRNFRQRPRDMHRAKQRRNNISKSRLARWKAQGGKGVPIPPPPPPRRSGSVFSASRHSGRPMSIARPGSKRVSARKMQRKSNSK